MNKYLCKVSKKKLRKKVLLLFLIQTLFHFKTCLETKKRNNKKLFIKNHQNLLQLKM